MKPTLFVFSLVALACASFTTHVPVRPAETPIAVTGGLVSGTATADGAVRVFKGIPFAAPPVGTLRWKAPQPVMPWTGVRRCEAYGASPMQAAPVPFGPWSAEYLIPNEPISEDCLYLNVWTGAKPLREKRPTLVWIYGGGFNSGGSGCAIYDGEAMARQGVVFVSINYRVGPFGFLAHPELSRESGRGASGNYGLMDQIAALRWVQQNIARFGGDPANVTIAGQSAGSMSVCCLVASPLAKGLFTKAIAQSGANVIRPLPTLQNAENEGQKSAQRIGATSLADLRAMSAADVLTKMQGQRGPIVDGYVLPRSVHELFAAGQTNDVALMTGWNEDEGMRFGPAKNAADYRQQIEKEYGSAAATYLTHYPATTNAEADRSQLDASRDQIFGAHNYAWANQQAGRGKPVYVYRFSRKLPAVGQYASYGAFHTGEVAYAYNNLRFIDRQLRPLTQTDDALARTMSGYWVNFIKTGNPNGNGLPQWPRYTQTRKAIIDLGDAVQARSLPDAARLDYMVKLIAGMR